ncbi:MAG: alpha/beta fold hydrolase [Phycisphaerales bacterium]
MLALALITLAFLQPAQPPQPPQPPPSPPAITAPSTFPNSLKGKWKGAIDLPGGNSLPFILTVTAADAATIAIPLQNLPDTPLSAVAISAEEMKFSLNIPGAPAAASPVFDLKLQADGSAKGTMAQNGLTLATTATHMAEGETGAPNRPQTPKGPFPYTTREVSYESFDGAAINGTLTIPPLPDASKQPKVPCVLFITGSGTQDRDETLFAHKPFAVIADALARAGIASLRVDDRGWNGAKNPAGLDATSETFGMDVACGLDFLARQPEIDARHIGLIGHSEGGLIAPAVAATKPEAVSFIVLMAGPGVTGREILERQLVAIMKAQSVDDAHISRASERQKRLLAAVAGGDQSAARQAVREGMQENDPNGSMQGKALEDATDMAMKQMDSSWMRHFLTRDPRADLRKTRCPVLILNGGKDTQVLAEQNVPEVVKALLESGNTAVTARVFPNLNHLFQSVGDKGTGGVNEYAQIETTIDPEALDFIVSWTRLAAKLPNSK